MGHKVLVTGGVRSGKSFHAETLLLGEPRVTYVAPGPAADDVADPEWAHRVGIHQARRPNHWSTVETTDLAGAIAAAEGAVLIDCLGTWLSALLDEFDVWDAVREEWEPLVMERVSATVDAWSASTATLVAVTNEVGMGIVPEHRSGRIFRDLLGTVNQRVAAASDEVLLVVAGRTISL
ncbi:MAG: bifunctional adenosylcobinamide kinase/adenosylcobinamide-phosphate guanylyltransferase [Nocardioidaceae bacterium]|nr:bifunctional adenosylcobinamide kinase/adenosylcobinamide-phosphate guanylyltransferase [Nocardioidaceae bacterium]